MTAQMAPASGHADPLAAVRRVLRVVRTSDSEIVLEGARTPFPQPWYRKELPVLLAAVSALLLFVPAGWVSLSAFAAPLMAGMMRLFRAERPRIALTRDSPRALWQRALLKIRIDCKEVTLAEDRLAAVLRTSGGDVRLPLRNQPSTESVSAAIAFINQFLGGAKVEPAAANDACLMNFGTIATSPDQIVMAAAEVPRLRAFAVIMSWAVITALAFATAVSNQDGLVALVLALAPAVSWALPIRVLTFERGRGLRVDGGPPSPFEVDLIRSEADDRPAALDIAIGSRFLRLVNASGRTKGLNDCAQLLKHFAPRHAGDCSAVSKTVTDLFRIGRSVGEGQSTILGRLRLRSLPLERSSMVFTATGVVVLPAVVSIIPLPWALGAIALFVSSMVVRALASLARPSLTFIEGTRRVIWRYRGQELPLTWRAASPAQTGEAMVVHTNAGPIRAPLRRRATAGEIQSFISELEIRHPLHPGDSVREDWPDSFSAALEMFEFVHVGPTTVGFDAGRMGLVSFALLFAVEAAVSFGMLAISPPAWVVGIAVVLMVSAPLLWAVPRISLTRGDPVAGVRIRGADRKESVTPSAFEIFTIGNVHINIAFGLLLHLDSGSWRLPVVVGSAAAAGQVRGALLGYLESGSFVGDEGNG